MKYLFLMGSVVWLFVFTTCGYANFMQEGLPLTVFVGPANVSIKLNTTMDSLELHSNSKSALFGIMYEYKPEYQPIISYFGATIAASNMKNYTLQGASSSETITVSDSRYFLSKTFQSGLKMFYKDLFYIRGGFNYTISSYDFSQDLHSVLVDSGFGYHYAVGADLYSFLNLELCQTRLTNNISGELQNIDSNEGDAFQTAVNFRFFFN